MHNMQCKKQTSTVQWQGYYAAVHLSSFVLACRQTIVLFLYTSSFSSYKIPDAHYAMQNQDAHANHCALPYLPILIIVVVTSVRIVILLIVFVIMIILTIVLFCPQLVKIILTFPDELDKVFFYKVTCNCPNNQHLIPFNLSYLPN